MSKFSPGHEAQRQLPVNENVARVAQSLADLAVGPGAASGIGGLAISEEMLGSIISARRERSNSFPPALFGEPAWDMLLVLLRGQLGLTPISVSTLYDAVGVSVRAADRWLDALAEQGLIVRRSVEGEGPHDLVELTPEANIAFRQFFSRVFRER